MSFFTNKKFLFKLITTICIFLTLFNFAIPPKVQAEAQDLATGGQILGPFVDLLCALGDGVMEIIQQSIMGTSATKIFDNTKGGWLGYIILAVAAVVLVFVCLPAGAFAAVTAWVTSHLVTLAATAIGIMVVNIATGGLVGSVATVIVKIVGSALPGNVTFPTYTIGPEEIFTGQILLFDPNIFDPEQVYVRFKENKAEDMKLEDWNETVKSEENTLTTDDIDMYYYIDEDKDEDGDGEPDEVATSVNNSAYELKNIIAKWYYVIRNIAIVGLMLVLMYVGIRMLLSSIASEKAKYKQMLFDWIIAMCLVFLLHYFMVFANNFVDNLVSIFATTTETQMHIGVVTEPTQRLKDAIKEIHEEFVQDDTIQWPTNMMGVIRLSSQQLNGEAGYVGYGLCYVVLVFYTAFFTFTYLKRLLYLMFLTVIAPLVALSYPLDKIRDGNAQAFNMWIKEYIINLLIQPFHLLLYIIFVTMAFDLAATNTIYSLVVIGFMIPAEKFLRKMFGFDRASSPGFLAGAAGVAMTMSAVKSLAGFASGGKNSSKSNNNNNNKIQQVSDGGADDSDSDHSMSALLDQTAGTQPDDLHDDGGPSPEGGPPGDNPGDEPPPGGGLPGDNPEDEPLPEGGLPDDNPEEPIPPEEQEERPSYFRARMNNLMRDKYGNKEWWKNAAGTGAKKTIRGVAKFGAGTTGALLGLTAGIASGSPGDALKYGIAGAYAGSSIGTGLSNRIGSRVSNTIEKEKQLHEEAMRQHLGEDEYKRRKEEESKKNFIKKDEEMRRKIAKEYNLKDNKAIDEKMEQAWEFKKWKVTDKDIIIKGMQLNESRPTDINSIAAARFAQISKSEKDLETNMKRYSKTNGITEAQVKQMERNIRKINDL